MNYITNFLTLQNQMRVFHWQTQKNPGSFAQHEAFGTAYDELDPLIDDFIEIYQGKKGNKRNVSFDEAGCVKGKSKR